MKNKVNIIGIAEATSPTAVADGADVNLWLDEYGAIVTNSQLRGVAETTTPSTVSDGAEVLPWFDEYGRQVVEAQTNGTSISLTPTVTAGAYVANDAVGGLLTFTNAARLTAGGGVIKDVLLLDDAGQDASLELWLFNATFTAMSDNAAWNPSQADLRKLVAIISIPAGSYFDAGTESAARVEVSQRYDVAATSLFGQLVTRGTPTYAATDDVTVIIGLLQD